MTAQPTGAHELRTPDPVRQRPTGCTAESLLNLAKIRLSISETTP